MVAILMATYNGEMYVAEQIESILNQTFSDWVLYIRDDGSTDKTVEILESFRNKCDKINLVTDDYNNKGAKWNFIHLLEIVDADYYMFCDQDDIWLPNKIEKSFSSLMKIEQFGIPSLVCCDLRVANQSLSTIYDSFWKYMKLSPKLLIQRKYAISCNLFTGCTMMFNRAAKEVSLPVHPTMILHDYWVGLNVIANNGNISVISEPLILYRQHQNNVCGAQPIGKSLSYYINKIIGINEVIKDYKDKYHMSNVIFKGKISIVYFLFNRFVYILRR